MAQDCKKSKILKYLLYLLTVTLTGFGLAILINAITLVGPLQKDFKIFPIFGIVYGFVLLVLTVFGVVTALRKSSRNMYIFAILIMIIAVIQVICLLYFNESALKRKLYNLYQDDPKSFNFFADNFLWRHPQNKNAFKICFSNPLSNTSDCQNARIIDFNEAAKVILKTFVVIFAILTLLKGIIFAVAVNLAFFLKEEREKNETAAPLDQKPGSAHYTRA